MASARTPSATSANLARRVDSAAPEFVPPVWLAARRAAPSPRAPGPADTGAEGDASLDSDGWLAGSLSPGSSPDRVAVSGPSLNVAPTAGSRGTYRQFGGALWAVAEDVGRLGSGRFVQIGGFNSTHQLRLGGGGGGEGLYELSKGTLAILPVGPDGPNAGAVASGIQVGGLGRGQLLIGDADSAGTVAFSGWPVSRHQAGAPGGPPPSSYGPPPRPAPGSDLVVRGDPRGAGLLLGWGGALGNGGALINNGRVIADAYGVDRALILLGYPSVTNTIDNPAAGGANGWFARNNGRLILPKISTAAGTNTYTWGENPADPTIDLVNSVRLTLRDARNAGKIDISLLDKHRSDVPELPAGHTFIGVWSIDTGMARPEGGIDLAVRYDDGLAHDLGLNEGILKLWRYAGGEWVRMDHDSTFRRDPALNLLSVHAPDGFTFFAVSAPEPGAAAMMLFAGGAVFLRRRQVSRGDGTAA